MNLTNYFDYLVYRCVTGSRAYGMATETSDLDVKGIFLPPYEFLVGIYQIEQIERKIEGLDDNRNLLGIPEEWLVNGAEFVYYTVSKYFKLARNANPNILELLFVRDSEVIWDGISERNRKIGQLIRDNRRLFLSQKVRHTYLGYAHAQLKRIKGHNKWLMNPQPEEKPKPSDFIKIYPLTISLNVNRAVMSFDGWIKLSDDEELSKHYMDRLHEMGAKPIPGTDGKVFLLFNRGKGVVDKSGALLSDYSYNYDPDSSIIGILVFQKDEYRSQLKKWKEYWTWVKNRNKVRSELEAKYSYDTKHAAHLVRLLRTGYELMSEGELRVWRPDADDLLAIRNGKLTYEELLAYAEELEHKISELYNSPKCPLPMKPNDKKINELLAEIIEYGIKHAR